MNGGVSESGVTRKHRGELGADAAAVLPGGHDEQDVFAARRVAEGIMLPERSLKFRTERAFERVDQRLPVEPRSDLTRIELQHASFL